MSGSSLDGLDIAYCEFQYGSSWHYNIIVSETISYPEHWLIALKDMSGQKGEILIEYDIKYGNYIAEQINSFINQHKLYPDIISSHGHTVFHNPDLSYTFQLGHGQTIATKTGFTTITDFRIGDILLEGQGAPLVPIGDTLLFGEYDYCLNIGGIANISYDLEGERVAMDICPANQLLNHLSLQIGKPYDENGRIAQLGKMNYSLFNALNNHPFYSLPHPKSMSNQLVSQTFISIVNKSKANVQDKLYTVCKHIAYQIKEIVKKTSGKNILITGGGAHNNFLVSAINYETLLNVVVPINDIVDYKEALIFAFMGVLKSNGEINCLASATGANRNSSLGIIHSP